MTKGKEAQNEPITCETDIPETNSPEISEKDSSNKPTEYTRSYIARVYVWCFFIAFLVVFIIGFCMKYDANQYKDLLITLSGILSGPLGFIVGYYFKASKE